MLQEARFSSPESRPVYPYMGRWTHIWARFGGHVSGLCVMLLLCEMCICYGMTCEGRREMLTASGLFL